MTTNEQINIALGAYDGSVLGLSLECESDGLLSLTARFAVPSHTGAVRALSLCGPALASGGYDETVRVYDINRRTELGTLFAHSGTVTSLAHALDPTRSLHVLSGGEDGVICVWRSRDWALLKALRGHSAGISALAVHPSSKLLLSTASDRAVLIWGLVKGKAVFSAKVKSAPPCFAQWAPDGNAYLLAAGNVLSVADVEARSNSSATFVNEKEIRAATFMDERTVLTGDEEGIVRLWDSRSGKIEREIVKHEGRIRGLAVVNELILSADSRGGVKITEKGGEQPRLQTSVGGGDMLLTCFAAWNPNMQTPDSVMQSTNVGRKKRRRKKTGVVHDESAAAKDEAESQVGIEDDAEEKEYSDENSSKQVRKRARGSRDGTTSGDVHGKLDGSVENNQSENVNGDNVPPANEPRKPKRKRKRKKKSNGTL